MNANALTWCALLCSTASLCAQDRNSGDSPQKLALQNRQAGRAAEIRDRDRETTSSASNRIAWANTDLRSDPKLGQVVSVRSIALTVRADSSDPVRATEGTSLANVRVENSPSEKSEVPEPRLSHLSIPFALHGTRPALSPASLSPENLSPQDPSPDPVEIKMPASPAQPEQAVEGGSAAPPNPTVFSKTLSKEQKAMVETVKSFPAGTLCGKPGFVKSPYAPFSELEATGLPSGSLARDPVSGKIFRIP
jgi:hypothetical protein